MGSLSKWTVAWVWPKHEAQFNFNLKTFLSSYKQNCIKDRDKCQSIVPMQCWNIKLYNIILK